MAELPIPDFLAEQTEEAIYEKMRAILPADIDSSEGSHVWNFLRPTALVLAELYEAILPRTLGLIFPKWSYGEYLEAHAQARGLTRRGTVAAADRITVTVKNQEDGSGSLYVSAGTRFATSAQDGEPNTVYEATEDIYMNWTAAMGTVVKETTEISLRVRCTEAGEIGNTGVGTITQILDPVSNVVAVTNPLAFTSGSDGESDEDLIARIENYDANQGVSYVGSVADYRRWALEVDGVGGVTVIPSEDGSGLVTIQVMDSSGESAGTALTEAVSRHILRPDDPEQRLAPVNASLRVKPADRVEIGVTAELMLVESATLQTVCSVFRTAMTAYLQGATQEGKVKYSRVAAILSGTAGVSDYRSLTIGIYGAQEQGTGNIEVTPGDFISLAEDGLQLTEVGE